MQKALSAVLFLAVIFVPYAPLFGFAPKAEAAVGDVTNFDNPGSTLWTVPAGVTYVNVKVWGAGGAAGNGEKISNQNRASLGGGAGGYTEQSISVTPGQTYLVDVGAGGQGIKSVAEGRVGNTGGDSKFEGNGVSLKATGGTGGATAVGFGNPMDPVGFGGIGDGGPDANNQGGGNSSPATWDGDNWDSSSGGSAYNGGQGGSRGRLGRDGTGHCNGYTEAYTGGPLNIPCSSTDAWAKDGQFPGGGGGGSDTGTGGFGANGRVTIEEVEAPDQAPQGFVDGADCSNIGGWAYDPDEPTTSIRVDMYADGPAGSGRGFSSSIANASRPDVNNAGIPGDHGYNVATPDFLKDGQSHDIYVYGINTKTNAVNTELLSSADNVTTHRTISGCTITPPVDNSPAVPTVGGPTTGAINTSYSFDATATDPEGSTVRYGFDWDNNGSVDEFTGFVNSGASASLSHSWPAAGTYTFAVYAFDSTNANRSGGASHTITISQNAPQPSISSVSISVTPNPAVVPVGSTLQLVVKSTVSVNGSANVTNHGIEASLDGGAHWQNAGSWNSPVANTERTSDGSFTSLNVSGNTTMMFRTYASIDNGATYTYSTPVTVPISTATAPALSSVDISVTPNPVSIPQGGSVQVVVTSTANTAGGATVTNHGLEKRVNGGAWQNAGAWGAPVGNAQRTSDNSFTGLNISSAGTYEFRAYASIDNGQSYIYSNPVTVPATVASNPTTTLNSVSISVTPNPIDIPIGGTVTVAVSSRADMTGPSPLTNHGIEYRLDGGAWTDAGSWPNPAGNTQRTSDSTFAPLNIGTPGTYDFRTYASIDNNLTRVYSNIVTDVATMASSNHSPVISSVTGPTTGSVNTSYAFTATATDQDGDQVQYGFDWNNNGVIDGSEAWAPAVTSGTPVSRSNIWTVNGAQPFQVLARDSSGAQTSYPFSITISGGASNIGFVIATSTTGFSTSEAGGTAVFTVTLASAPLANVTLPVMSTDFTEGTTSVTSLLFTPSDWNVPHSVTITGVDDALFDGPISYGINVGPSTSSDVNYNNLAVQTVSLTNADNEINGGAGATIGSFSVSPTSIETGNGTVISWSVTNATLCVASGAWSGTKNPSSGSEPLGPYMADSTVLTNTYVLNCGNSTGTTTATTTLTVNPVGSSHTSGGSGGGGGGGSGGPCIGFGCSSASNTTTTTTTTVETPTVTIVSGGDYPPAAPTIPNPPRACNYADFITTYLRSGIENNPNEVKKLQYFLNTYDGANLSQSGTFDAATEDAVRAFQSRHAEEVLSPWGTNAPTGIVYITTRAAINRIFCGDNPNYRGDDDLKDILNPVLYTPPADNSDQFQNVVGSATTSTSTNLAGVFGAISGDMLNLLKGVPWYELLLLLLLLLGTGVILQGIAQKDITSPSNTALLVKGITVLAVGSVLNVLNTVSFMMRPDWFSSKTGIGVSWILGLDAVNLLAVAVICVTLLGVIQRRLSSPAVPSAPAGK